MSHNHFGVKYPDGTWSGPISPTTKDLKPYARLHHGTIYEAGTAEDPAPRHQAEAEPWVFDADRPERIDTPCFASAEDEYRPERIEDIAAAKADIENATRKCYPEFDLASKFGA